MSSSLSRTGDSVNPLLVDPSVSSSSQRVQEPHTVTFGGGPDAYRGSESHPIHTFNGSLTVYLKSEKEPLDEFYLQKQKTWKIVNFSALGAIALILIPAAGTYHSFDLSKLITGAVSGGVLTLILMKVLGLQEAPKVESYTGVGALEAP